MTAMQDAENGGVGGREECCCVQPVSPHPARQCVWGKERNERPKKNLQDVATGVQRGSRERRVPRTGLHHQQQSRRGHSWASTGERGHRRGKQEGRCSTVPSGTRSACSKDGRGQSCGRAWGRGQAAGCSSDPERQALLGVHGAGCLTAAYFHNATNQ